MSRLSRSNILANVTAAIMITGLFAGIFSPLIFSLSGCDHSVAYGEYGKSGQSKKPEKETTDD